MLLYAAVNDWTPVVSTGLAALAALASWVSVRQSRRNFLPAQLPDLEIAVIEGLDTGTVRVHIENYGSGGARAVRSYVVEGTQVTGGALPPTGNLPAGESRTLRTALSVTKRTGIAVATGIAVVICRDGFGRVHAWNLRGDHKRWNLRFPWNRNLSNQRIFRRFHPNAPDVTTQTLVRHEVVG